MQGNPLPRGLETLPSKSHLQSSHRTYYELVENKGKKKKLEHKFTEDRRPPPGFEFVPVGNPVLTAACKDLSRELEALIFIVTWGVYYPGPDEIAPGDLSYKFSSHVHRIGYHFRENIVSQVRERLGVAHDPAQAHRGRPEPIPDTQQEIDRQADEAIRDLFPRIPNFDREAIVRRAFYKRAGTRDDPRDTPVGLAANLTLAHRTSLAVLAHIRHAHTRYDQLLQETSYPNARRAVQDLCLQYLVRWRGDEENGRDDMDEILREVIVISDSESDDEDGDDEDEGEREKDQDGDDEHDEDDDDGDDDCHPPDFIPLDSDDEDSTPAPNEPLPAVLAAAALSNPIRKRAMKSTKRGKKSTKGQRVTAQKLSRKARRRAKLAARKKAQQSTADNRAGTNRQATRVQPRRAAAERQRKQPDNMPDSPRLLERTQLAERSLNPMPVASGGLTNEFQVARTGDSRQDTGHAVPEYRVYRTMTAPNHVLGSVTPTNGSAEAAAARMQAPLRVPESSFCKAPRPASSSHLTVRATTVNDGSRHQGQNTIMRPGELQLPLEPRPPPQPIPLPGPEYRPLQRLWIYPREPDLPRATESAYLVSPVKEAMQPQVISQAHFAPAPSMVDRSQLSPVAVFTQPGSEPPHWGNGSVPVFQTASQETRANDYGVLPRKACVRYVDDEPPLRSERRPIWIEDEGDKVSSGTLRGEHERFYEIETRPIWINGERGGSSSFLATVGGTGAGMRTDPPASQVMYVSRETRPVPGFARAAEALPPHSSVYVEHGGDPAWRRGEFGAAAHPASGLPPSLPEFIVVPSQFPRRYEPRPEISAPGQDHRRVERVVRVVAESPYHGETPLFQSPPQRPGTRADLSNLPGRNGEASGWWASIPCPRDTGKQISAADHGGHRSRVTLITDLTPLGVTPSPVHPKRKSGLRGRYGGQRGLRTTDTLPVLGADRLPGWF